MNDEAIFPRRRTPRFTFALGALAAAVMLAACGDDAKNKAASPSATGSSAPAPAAPSPSQGSTGSAASTSAAATPASVSADPLAPRYDATLAQGIDFRKPGYPKFVAEAAGISGVESWGRWTDGSTARLRFNQLLPASFTLNIEAGAIGPNFGKAVIVRAGKAQQSFIVTAAGPGTPPGLATFALKFEGATGDTIEIVPPRPVTPGEMDPRSTDKRLLGVGLVSLKIQG